MAYQTYQVKAGDTLSRIASMFGTTIAAIAKGNGIADANKISVGQELIIQTPDASADVLPEVTVTNKPRTATAQPLPKAAAPSVFADLLKPPKVYMVGALAAVVLWVMMTSDE